MKSSIDDAQYDDERLISLIAQSREDALSQLYDRYSYLVFSIAVAIVDDRSTAEEITLDVFVRVWQKSGSYRADRAKVRTWLTHIARHHAIDVLRRQSTKLDSYTISWDGVSSSATLSAQDPQELTELSQRREHVRAAISRLPEDQKQALALAYYGGLTQLEIAEALKQPLGTIKTRLRLAMQKLCDLLQDEQELVDTSIEAMPAYSMNRDDS
ncbi:MAG TPA: sigma-70 family RNA polymerase sigma factor [Anaerolineales bacterium]|nr:sigma-70 family RNA polymerase sigma factor [Anaerolineales bacterium]